MQLLEEVAERTWAAVERSKAEAALESELDAMTRLRELSERLLTTADVSTALGEVLDTAISMHAADRGTVQIYDPAADVLRYAAARGFDRAVLDSLPIVDRDFHSTCAVALRTGQRVIASDIATDSRFVDHAATAAGLDYRAALSSLLTTRQGEFQGVLTVHFREPHVPTDRELRRADLYARMAAHLIERQRDAEALKESEERFRMVADNMSQLAWTCDRLGNVTWYNERWLDYTGLTFEELKGWDWSKVLHPEHLERVVEGVKQSAETGEPWEDVFPLRGKDGVYRWFLSRALPIRDADGQITRWFGTNTDITQQRDLEDALKEADRRKDEFLATLAHELRNPLAPIRNGLQIMRLARHDTAAFEQSSGMMERQLTQMVRLIDDLLDLSRVSRGKVELRNERAPLVEVIHQAVETSRPLIEACRHEFLLDMPPEPIYVDADLIRLAQVFANLLNNAAKYTEPGGRVVLTVERQGGEALVSVRDNGVGIPAHMLPKVFDIFTQVDRTSKKAQGGLGIGLSLVKKLVEMHGGSVEAKSDGHGMGSEFSVRLPVVLALAVEQSDAVSEPKSGQTALRRILVVDDNRDSAHSLAMLLRIMGNDTQTAHDGLEALDAVAAFRPEVVLLDIGMPKLDGYQTASRIRQMGWGKHITLVAQTGWGQDADKRRSQEAGFDFHMVKPIDPAALEQLLAELKTATA